MTESGRQPESAHFDVDLAAIGAPSSLMVKQPEFASSTSLGIDFFAGCLGGAAGVFAGHPFDTVKVRLQTAASAGSRGGGVSGGATPASSSTLRLFSAILRDEGARGLYKGISSPLASVAFLNAIIFGAHGATYKWLQGGGENTASEEDGSPLRHHFIAGFVAGSAQAVLASPMEMLKLRAQLNQSGTRSLSPYACFRQIVADGGARALTRGFWATQLRDSTGVAVYFTVYEMLTRRMSGGGSDTEAAALLNPLQLMLAGGLAGTASWLCNYPVDVVKTRLQASRTPLAYATLIREMYADRGLSAFFVGLESTLLRAFPTNAATFFTVEWTYRCFHKFQNNHNEQQQQRSQQFAANNNNNNNKSKKLSNPTRGDGHLSFYADLWTRNSFLLPEAGCTLIDPIVSRCRKSGPYNSAIAAAL